MSEKLFPGSLITFEGIDGAGKTELLKRIAQKLTAEDQTVIKTKEPGGTKIGRMLKRVLLEEEKKCHERVEYLLYAADRAEHFEEIVIPGLENGSVILSDRMADSALAYQGYGRNLDKDMITNINRWAMIGIEPDLTFYIKIDYKTAHARIDNRKNTRSIMEQEQEAFWNRVINGYNEISKTRENIITLSGLDSPEELFEQAYKHVRKLLEQKQALIREHRDDSGTDLHRSAP